MKFAKKHIPSPPSPPSPKSAPNAPGAGQIPGPPGSGGGGMPGGFPPGMMDSDSWIAKMISGDMFGGKMSITPEQIKEAMRSINLDDYRDEEGVVRCPLSKAEREALIDKLR